MASASTWEQTTKNRFIEEQIIGEPEGGAEA
jgi:hypothetical protein